MELREIYQIEGTSKLSPYIKHGQIHVETIWKRWKSYWLQKYINERMERISKLIIFQKC